MNRASRRALSARSRRLQRLAKHRVAHPVRVLGCKACLQLEAMS